MNNLPQKQKRKSKPQELNPYHFIAGIVFLGVMVLIVFYGLVLMVSVNDMLYADCMYPQTTDFVQITGDVVAPSDVNVDIQIKGGAYSCQHPISYTQWLALDDGAFEASLPYFANGSPVVVTFSADGYTSCSVEYNVLDHADMQFYVELDTAWTITVTNMTLDPPRYVPHQQTFNC